MSNIGKHSAQIRDTRQELSVAQSLQMTGSLAKGLYEALFEFIVDLIRARLKAQEGKFSEGQEKSESEKHVSEYA